MNSYKDLIVWQKGFALVLEIYNITGTFPKSETYGLMSQMRRASVSVPSNISEGYSRKLTREFIQFNRYAFASLTELETQLLIAKHLRYVSDQKYNDTQSLVVEVAKMLNALITSLKRKVRE